MRIVGNKAADKWRAALFFFILKSFTADGARYCFHGNIVNNEGSLRRESCLDRKLHEHKAQMSHENQTSEAPLEAKQAEEDQGSPDSLSWSEVDHESVPVCYIFRHITTTIYTIKQESVDMVFGCDFGHLCDKKELNKVLYNATRQNSQLFCCNDENCNNADKLPHMALENQLCYHGSNNGTDSPTAEIQPCSNPDVSCARKTTFLPQGMIEDYFCDNDDSCAKYIASGAYRTCTNTTADNITQQLCCCKSNKCFVPQWPSPSVDDANKTASPVKVPPLQPMGSTIHKPGPKKRSTALITGIVSALVIMTVFAAAAILITTYKRRKRQMRNPNVIMQYERLSVSDKEVEDAVVL
ncbi:hypothetical protein EGW08_015444 [Elysia chlorotica]|uniref:Activin types I and II receptor domain-containing protein n=1 Tax=Elysia chlorotica TaxID=188477 RepID=A0A433T5H0_ELYCH|nr:hypothetical protein EGW08_015444 [Elysia chlorotica]